MLGGITGETTMEYNNLKCLQVIHFYSSNFCGNSAYITYMCFILIIGQAVFFLFDNPLVQIVQGGTF